MALSPKNQGGSITWRGRFCLVDLVAGSSASSETPSSFNGCGLISSRIRKAILSAFFSQGSWLTNDWFCVVPTRGVINREFCFP
jgi:hypothetical protein